MDEKLTKNSSMAGLFDEPIEPPPENFTKTVNTWAESTTMHGIASIAQSKSTAKKIIWVAFLLLAAGGSSWYRGLHDKMHR